VKFAVTWDYRCPFARNAHEHLAAGLLDGAPWEDDFLPFALNPDWDAPDNLLALMAGVVVRDRRPEQFLRAHLALFAARHDHGADLRKEDVIAAALQSVGVPADDVVSEIRTGRPLQVVRKAHEEEASTRGVFGVPTFILGTRAVFVRIMTRPEGDVARARKTIEMVVDLIGNHPELNEFKATTIDQ